MGLEDRFLFLVQDQHQLAELAILEETILLAKLLASLPTHSRRSGYLVCLLFRTHDQLAARLQQDVDAVRPASVAEKRAGRVFLQRAQWLQLELFKYLLTSLLRLMFQDPTAVTGRAFMLPANPVTHPSCCSHFEHAEKTELNFKNTARETPGGFPHSKRRRPEGGAYMRPAQLPLQEGDDSVVVPLSLSLVPEEVPVPGGSAGAAPMSVYTAPISFVKDQQPQHPLGVAPESVAIREYYAAVISTAEMALAAAYEYCLLPGHDRSIFNGLLNYLHELKQPFFITLNKDTLDLIARMREALLKLSAFME